MGVSAAAGLLPTLSVKDVPKYNYSPVERTASYAGHAFAFAHNLGPASADVPS